MNLIFEENKLLKNFSTLGVGGPSRFFVEVCHLEELKTTLSYCQQRNLPFFILGKGSNCLFDDRGFNGLVILNKIDFISQPTEGTFYVGSGYSFSLLGTQTARQGWSGLEFATGIPGSVGGAIYMNAGANGCDTSASLMMVEYLNEFGVLQVFEKKDLSFSYRTSPFQKMRGCIVGAKFQLIPATTARQKQLEIIQYRTKTQPYGEKSAGCFFRNPSCQSAGALIDQAGLKGLQVGGAKVSELHANFIINTHQATAKDILKLVEIIKEKIKQVHGLEMETEVCYIPYKDEIV